jgi:hypothetical protein
LKDDDFADYYCAASNMLGKASAKLELAHLPSNLSPTAVSPLFKQQPHLQTKTATDLSELTFNFDAHRHQTSPSDTTTNITASTSRQRPQQTKQSSFKSANKANRPKHGKSM